MDLRKILSILLISAGSCISESGGKVDSFVSNNSGFILFLDHYKNGILSTELSKEIPAGIKSEVLVVSGGESLPSYPTNLGIQQIDSLILRFSDGKKITYCNFRNNCSAHALNFENERNLLNVINWRKLVVKDLKKYYEAEYFFIVSEEDYANSR